MRNVRYRKWRINRFDVGNDKDTITRFETYFKEICDDITGIAALQLWLRLNSNRTLYFIRTDFAQGVYYKYARNSTT